MKCLYSFLLIVFVASGFSHGPAFRLGGGSQIGYFLGNTELIFGSSISHQENDKAYQDSVWNGTVSRYSGTFGMVQWLLVKRVRGVENFIRAGFSLNSEYQNAQDSDYRYVEGEYDDVQTKLKGWRYTYRVIFGYGVKYKLSEMFYGFANVDLIFRYKDDIRYLWEDNLDKQNQLSIYTSRPSLGVLVNF